MAEEKMQQRFGDLERSLKVLMALVLVSLTCSLAALAITVVVLLTVD